MYYVRSIKNLDYHWSYYRILVKHNAGHLRQVAFPYSPGSIVTQYDYINKFIFDTYGQLKVYNFAINKSLYSEGCFLDYLSTPKKELGNIKNGKHYTKNIEYFQYVFYSNFCDMAAHNE